MSTIYLFRHGQTEFNRDKVFTGLLDSKLTEEGIRQAQYLALLLKDKRINVAYQSSLSRSRDTLNEILQFHPECGQPLTDDRITERSYGDLSGRSHAEVIAEFGQEQFDRWHRGWHERPHNGESFADVEIRVQSFITDLYTAYHHQDLGIVISAHGNSIRLLRKILENAHIDDASSWTIPYDQFFEYKI